MESVPLLARDALAAHMQDGVLILDHRDRLVGLNPAAARIIGHPGQTGVGKPISEVRREIADILDHHPVTGAIEEQQILSVNSLDLKFKVKITPVRHGILKRAGRMVMLSNVTGREEMEKTLHEHTRELARSNKLITTLSNVATRIGGTPSIEAGFEVLGAEMRKLDLDCGVVTIDPEGETATIKYLSFNPALLRKAEKLTGISAKDYVIPKRYWPGDRILKEKQPVWYPDPHVYIRRMFPQIPDVLANRALRLLGIQPESQICILPLLVEDNLIGAMPIWGVDLHSSDNPVLALFASQVAGVLQNTLIRDSETMRANELARSNAMVLALSKVATLLGNSSNTEVVLDTLGSEIRGLGLDCGIVTLDQGGETATVKYLSFAPAVIQQVEKLAGVSIQDYSIPRRYWPDDKAVREKTPVWYSDPSDILLRMFPKIPEKIARRSLQLFGFSPETQLCMLPLTNNEQMIGAILIWGVDLRLSDTPVLAVFAGQVAGILQKIEAYETEVERADMLTHSNSLILALSKVAAKLESSANSAEIFNTVGKELQKMGLESIIGTLDDSRQNLQIKYLSVRQDVIRWAEK
ncbi:MAG: PAS domain-containing protein, partial [Anaerolineales bacterium]|nr:PAS domain-containing protein [Anaerolineales bacterium]